MNKSRVIRQSIAIVFMAASAIILAASLLTGTGSEDPEAAAADFGKRTSARIRILDRYIDKALNSDLGSWMELKGVPASPTPAATSHPPLPMQLPSFPL